MSHVINYPVIKTNSANWMTVVAYPPHHDYWRTWAETILKIKTSHSKLNCAPCHPLTLKRPKSSQAHVYYRTVHTSVFNRTIMQCGFETNYIQPFVYKWLQVFLLKSHILKKVGENKENLHTEKEHENNFCMSLRNQLQNVKQDTLNTVSLLTYQNATVEWVIFVLGS